MIINKSANFRFLVIVLAIGLGFTAFLSILSDNAIYYEEIKFDLDGMKPHELIDGNVYYKEERNGQYKFSIKESSNDNHTLTKHEIKSSDVIINNSGEKDENVVIVKIPVYESNPYLWFKTNKSEKKVYDDEDLPREIYNGVDLDSSDNTLNIRYELYIDMY